MHRRARTAVTCIAACTLSALATPASPAAAPLPHYDLHLQLDPASGHVAVRGTLGLSSAAPGDSLVFRLHRQLAITEWSVNGVTGHGRDDTLAGVRHQPEATTVRSRVPATHVAGDPVTIAFAHAGVLDAWPEWSASVIGSDWTEMGLYFPWFPDFAGLAPYTYRVAIVTDPSRTVWALGAASRDGDARVFTTTAPTNDIVVVASPDLRIHQADGVQVVSRTLAPATVDTLAADLTAMRARYTAWFGPTPGGLALVESSRERGGGYARRGALYLAGLADADYFDLREGYARYLGHELAHLWWYRADTGTWEDWLNESLAEFSALALVRERFGPDAYAARLARKRETCAGTPPIVGLDRNGSEHAEAVLYGKGPVLLAELEDRLGEAALRELLRATYARAVTTTEAFLALLAEQAEPATADWFGEQLRVR
ncbi:MAG: hypothetical protein R6X25_02590 [Candidatus Krumholzibacteriia bacterium]